MARKNSSIGRSKNITDYSYLVNKSEVADKNEQQEEQERQFRTMTAFGIDGLGLTPLPKEDLGNEDVEADMENERV